MFLSDGRKADTISGVSGKALRIVDKINGILLSGSSKSALDNYPVILVIKKCAHQKLPNLKELSRNCTRIKLFLESFSFHVLINNTVYCVHRQK